jgi:hypothetical protein
VKHKPRTRSTTPVVQRRRQIKKHPRFSEHRTADHFPSPFRTLAQPTCNLRQTRLKPNPIPCVIALARCSACVSERTCFSSFCSPLISPVCCHFLKKLPLHSHA